MKKIRVLIIFLIIIVLIIGATILIIYKEFNYNMNIENFVNFS